jgi:hypothetical protein
MQRFNPDEIACVLIPHFLRALMKTEREQQGIAQKDASLEAGWSAAAWGAIERGARPLDKDQWIQASRALGITTQDLARHLNSFIVNYPSVWVEILEDGDLVVCERPVTSPRALRSGRVAGVDLNPIRPILYHELSNYVQVASELISAAVGADYYTSRENTIVPTHTPSHPIMEVDRRMHIIQIINEMSPEKFGLLERVIDKFSRYPAKQLAVAYQHFSLSVKNQ